MATNTVGPNGIVLFERLRLLLSAEKGCYYDRKTCHSDPLSLELISDGNTDRLQNYKAPAHTDLHLTYIDLSNITISESSEMSSCINITFKLVTPSYTVTLPSFAPSGISTPDGNAGQSWSVSQIRTLQGTASRCEVEHFDQDRTDEPSTVIMKLGVKHETRKKHEEEAYCYIHYLRELQGELIPRFLGFFKGCIGEGNNRRELSCLLLEDCGTCLDDIAFEAHKVQLGNALARFHLQVPFNYRQIAPEHTLFMPNSERLVLINFSKLEEHDDCHFKESIMGVPFSEIIDKRLPDPGLNLLGCEEIHEYCMRNRLVVPCTFPYRRTIFTITADIQTEEQLISKVKSEYPSSRDTPIIQRRCKEAWPKFSPHLKKYSQVPWTKAQDTSEALE